MLALVGMVVLMIVGAGDAMQWGRR